MNITRPILIVGTGRCGSTLFHNLLARHPGITWFSGACNRWPRRPWINRAVLKSCSFAPARPLIRRWAPPSETTRYWEYLAPGFSWTQRDLDAGDLLPGVKKHVHTELSRHFVRGRPCQLHKFTGWPRLGYLHDLFPDAFFIHIIRDPRAVACSFLNVEWWLGWRGPENWLWGPLPAEYDREWRSSGRCYVVLSAIQWKILMDAFQATRNRVPPDRWIELRYEELVADPVSVCRRVLEFCRLDTPSHFIASLARLSLANRNDKWKEQLTADQRDRLNASLAGHLEQYGYI